MVRVGDNGKYKVGDKLIIFVRILRRHIMVRVGGGWQELSEFLRVKDPCRSSSKQITHSNAIHNHHHHPTQFHTKIAPYSQSLNNSNNQNLSLNTSYSKSRFIESGGHQLVSKGYYHNPSKNSNATGCVTNSNIPTYNMNSVNTGNVGGQRLISGSASMSWLSHNSW